MSGCWDIAPCTDIYALCAGSILIMHTAAAVVISFVALLCAGGFYPFHQDRCTGMCLFRRLGLHIVEGIGQLDHFLRVLLVSLLDKGRQIAVDGAGKLGLIRSIHLEFIAGFGSQPDRQIVAMALYELIRS